MANANAAVGSEALATAGLAVRPLSANSPSYAGLPYRRLPPLPVLARGFLAFLVGLFTP